MQHGCVRLYTARRLVKVADIPEKTGHGGLEQTDLPRKLVKVYASPTIAKVGCLHSSVLRIGDSSQPPCLGCYSARLFPIKRHEYRCIVVEVVIEGLFITRGTTLIGTPSIHRRFLRLLPHPFHVVAGLDGVTPLDKPGILRVAGDMLPRFPCSWEVASPSATKPAHYAHRLVRCVQRVRSTVRGTRPYTNAVGDAGDGLRGNVTVSVMWCPHRASKWGGDDGWEQHTEALTCRRLPGR